MAERFDAVIVGSGATGGWVAHQLTEAGLRVAVLEAGRKLDPSVDFHEHKLPHDMPLRGRRYGPRETQDEQPIQKLCYQCDEYTQHLFVKDTEHPYTTPKDRVFTWIRGRHVGGKSIMWARQSYRLSNYDFKAASRDGFGADWPITYEELAPYYDRVERFVGISGQAEGLAQLPDGQFLPPMHMTCGEHLLKKAVADRFGRTVTIGRTAVLTANHNGRPQCHYCGPCSRGCTTGSYYSSPASTLPAAAATRRMTLVPNAVVSHVVVDGKGKCKGVYYVDRLTRQQREVFGKLVILCASTLESTRIMLNSRSPLYPAGIANSSGVLGHYLMDHVMGGDAIGVLPVLNNVPDTRGNRPNGIYIPRFRNIDSKSPAFIRGYGYQGSADYSKWGHAFAMPGFGASFKKSVKENRPWTINLGGFGECLGAVRELLRARQERRGCVGHSGAAHQRRVRRQRAQDGPGHVGLRGGNARSGRRGRYQADGGHVYARAGHPRSGDRPHGRGSESVRAEPLATSARRFQPVRDGRIVLPVVCLSESYADPDGTGRPKLRSAGRGIEGGPGLEGSRVPRFKGSKVQGFKVPSSRLSFRTRKPDSPGCTLESGGTPRTGG